jgi:thioredoxin 1
MTSRLITHTSDATFDADVMKATTPVLVDFWAECCGPCKAIAPMLEELAPQYEGKIRIAKLNVDQNGATGARFNIRSIPTLLLFHKGKIVASKIGAVPLSHLKAFLDDQLRQTAA